MTIGQEELEHQELEHHDRAGRKIVKIKQADLSVASGDLYTAIAFRNGSRDRFTLELEYESGDKIRKRLSAAELLHAIDSATNDGHVVGIDHSRKMIFFFSTGFFLLGWLSSLVL